MANRTVLLVEDDPLFRKALSTVLASLGVQLVAVESGEAALATAGTRSIDMVLMDYHLPGMNGVELARSLRDRNIHSPMILISGFLTDSVHHEAREAHIARILRKPTDMASLQDTVLTVLEQSGNQALPV
jgi:CheY-like chemotaxis protein